MESRNSLRWNPSRVYTENGVKYKIVVNASLDDDCKNIHCDFSITCDIYEIKQNGREIWVSGGCCHEEIVKHFPEIERFIPLHLCSHEGTPTYPEANGIYFIENEKKSVAMDYLRITSEEYEILQKYTDEKLYFKYLLFSLGIVDRWKREADDFIAFLEEKCGYKWENPYTPEVERFRLTLTDGERLDVENKLKSGGYTQKSIEQKRKEEFEEYRSKECESIVRDYEKKIQEAKDEKMVKLFILNYGFSLKNVIFYHHSMEVHFNWKSYEKLISKEDFKKFVKYVDKKMHDDYYILPEGITFHLDENPKY